MNNDEKKRLRNQISAQQARLRKKDEQEFLNLEVRKKDELYEGMVKVLMRSNFT